MATADQDLAEVRVEAAFDKPEYTSGAQVKLTLKVTNVGSVAAEKVVQVSDGNFFPDWGDLQYGKGVSIQPGETRTFEVSQWMYQVSPAVTSRGRLIGPNIRTGSEPMWDLSSTVRETKGGWHGVVYGDRNTNGHPDQGEYLADAEVIASGGAPYQEYKALTDANGRFDFPSLPTGRYNTYYHGPDGWLLHGDEEQIVQEGASGETVVRGLRPLSDRLKVSMAFTKKTYQPGETAKVNVRLTNRGSTPVNGIVAAICNGIGDPNQLLGNGPGWGDLRYDAAGVNLAAGETKVIQVAEEVPAAAKDWGNVIAACSFGPSTEDLYGFPQADDTALVPGIKGSATVHIVQNGGSPVPGAHLAVTNSTTGRQVARPVTDANGVFTLTDLQVGTYQVTYLGAWQPVGSSYFRVWADGGEQWLTVEPCPS